MLQANARRILVASAVAVVLVVGLGADAFAQVLPNPYRQVDGWAKLPDGRQMGAVGGVTTDDTGDHIWAVIRCDASAPERFGNECLDSDLDPVVQFDLDGNVVTSFGGGLFIWPHGIDVDSEGNVWVTDAVSEARTPPGTRGHQVIKFSPEGEVLMTLGTPGVAGGGKDHFNAPADVVVADNGDVFVADGHANDTNNRVVKFSKDGTYIKEWGKSVYAPGEFRTPARHRHGRRRPHLRRRPLEQPRPDLRPGRRLPSPSGRSSAARAASSSTTTAGSTWPTPSRTTCRTPAGRWASASAR